jgi:uncharacterized membrane protein
VIDEASGRIIRTTAECDDMYSTIRLGISVLFLWLLIGAIVTVLVPLAPDPYLTVLSFSSSFVLAVGITYALRDEIRTRQ